jgi:hypothetical protein
MIGAGGRRQGRVFLGKVSAEGWREGSLSFFIPLWIPGSWEDGAWEWSGLLLGRGRGSVFQDEENKDAQTARWKKDWMMWCTHSTAMRTKIGLPKDSKPWTERARLSRVPSNERVRDVIDVAFYSKVASSPVGTPSSVVTRKLLCDVSQAVQRSPWTSTGGMTLRTNTVLYSFEHDVCLSAASNLRTLGWSYDHCLPAFKGSDLRTLAGEAYSLPLCSLTHAGVFCNPYALWWQ